ncbi:NhaP-type Na+/H+ and K+/H+ antiporter [Gaiella occulta]|uniref:NhaP-type Na+/H+ and K+/H+ antiporter n=1 Tax=Gaiella occulta TaxID=1002870 RepID=A0A7M2YY24_9ACTN|nr:cation:proton antiporter [Gaiella occulta]RDI74970.1 NhaP-type Na+/H+ and K+/H+ antiporter [Gaiella occulta]
MNETTDFAAIVAVVALALFAAISLRSLTARVAIPGAALFLVLPPVAAELFPSLGSSLSILEVERITTVALIVILFDGGLHIGLRRFRASAGPILSIGVLGTFATAGMLAAAAHWALGLDWKLAGLVGAALAPTDPAVTFSVFGNREIRGRSGTILEGESGANDPVGIALMIGMIEFATTEGASFSVVVREFAIEMGVGLAIGIAAAAVLLPVFRRVSLPEPSLYPLRVLAGAGLVFGVSALVHGSGFIAVFVAGILLGDAAMPRKGETERFSAGLASLAEITAFIALGLSVDFDLLRSGRLWLDGAILFVLLTFVVRPLAVGPLLLPARLRPGERLFVTLGGLKGAVPILLAALAVIAGVERPGYLYGVVYVVVLLSVVLLGTSMPVMAARLGIPFRTVSHDLAEAREFTVAARAFADGRRLDALPLAERAWVGGVVRDGRRLQVADQLTLATGDRIDVYCEPSDEPALRRVFEGT